jgi:Ca2+-binding RTX toxin-like protein
MASLYRDLLAGWRDAGGTLFVHYLDVAMPSQWGSWGALRHLDDANPRWEELLAHNAVAPEWESRDPSAFANGRAVSGTPGGDTLEGTTEEDDLLAGGGDDTLIADGADRLHGGEGFDRAILSGGQSDWSRRSEGATEILTKGWITVRLTEIEEVTFADTGETFSVPSSR